MRHTVLLSLLKYSLLLFLSLAWLEGLFRLLTGVGLGGHPQLLSALVILVLASSLTVVLASRRWVRWHFGPQRVDIRDANTGLADVVHVLHRQASLLKIAPPVLHVYESDDLNAFIVGGIWQQQHLYLSESLFRQLSPDEIEAVIAHEIAHIYYRDVVVNEAFFGMSMICQYLSQYTLGNFLVLLAKDRNRETAKSIAMILVYGGMLFPLWLVMLVYRRRSEYRADALASKLVGHEQYLWLLYRLKTMRRDKVLILEWLPVLRDYFTSHPPIRHRINALCTDSMADGPTWE